MERRAAALASRFDDLDRPQAVRGSLREEHAAPKHLRQVACAERLSWKRWERAENVARAAELDAAKHVPEPALAGISCSPAHRLWSSGPDMVLAHQDYLDGQVRMREQRRKGDELVEHVDRGSTLRRRADRDHLAVFIDPHDPPLCRNRMHDPNMVDVEQRIELSSEWAEAPRLDLDELPVGADKVDHEAAHLHLEPVTRTRQDRLERTVQRPLAHHADAGHASQAKAGVGAGARSRGRMVGRLGADALLAQELGDVRAGCFGIVGREADGLR